MVPNTMKNGGNIDLTPTNEAAIWDAVEVYGQQANYPTQYTWLSAKLKEGYNGKLSYRPFVNHGGWLKFYSDGEPAGGSSMICITPFQRLTAVSWALPRKARSQAP